MFSPTKNDPLPEATTPTRTASWNGSPKAPNYAIHCTAGGNAQERWKISTKNLLLCRNHNYLSHAIGGSNITLRVLARDGSKKFSIADAAILLLVVLLPSDKFRYFSQIFHSTNRRNYPNSRNLKIISFVRFYLHTE